MSLLSKLIKHIPASRAYTERCMNDVTERIDKLDVQLNALIVVAQKIDEIIRETNEKTLESIEKQSNLCEVKLKESIKEQNDVQYACIEEMLEKYRQWEEAALEAIRNWQEEYVRGIITDKNEQAVTEIKALMTESLDTIEDKRRWAEQALTEFKLWEEGLTKEHICWEEKALSDYRNWEEDLTKEHIAWEEKAMAEYRLWEERLTKGHAEWEEKALQEYQAWNESFVRGEISNLKYSNRDVVGMLELLGKREINALEERISFKEQGFRFIAEADITHSVNELRVLKKASSKQIVVFCGDNIKFDRGTCAYMGGIAEKNSDYSFLHLSEATFISLEESRKKSYIPFHIVPDIVGKRYHDENYEVYIDEESAELLDSKSELSEAVCKACKQNPNATESIMKYVILSAYKYYNDAFSVLSPACVFIHNPFYYLHQVIKLVARERGIKTIITEFGNIPGTFSFDTNGILGDSYPCVDWKQFKELEVSKDEQIKAQEVIRYINDSCLNRYKQVDDPQVTSMLEEIKESGKKIIVYAEQLDEESGLFPVTTKTKEQYSPCVESSEELLKYLDSVAEENNWEIVYKLHPHNNSVSKVNYKHVRLIRKYDINKLVDLADVTVTILSSVGYTSILRGRPTVILGNTELKGKGCVYEVAEKDDIEAIIKEALDKGVTEDMRKALTLHVAQMLKYYLFDDNNPRKLRYGRCLENFEIEKIS